MKKQSQLKILLSGPGLIGRKHAALLEASARAELSGIVAPPREENINFARSRRIPQFDTIEAALDVMEIDGVIIASPNAFHEDQALACIKRGIPVLVEKPLTADIKSATAVWLAAKHHGVSVLVGHHRTYSPLLETARAFLASERFGMLVALQGSALFHKPTQYFRDGPWRTQPGGGPLLINLIHEIGIMQYLCGPIHSVIAEGSNSRRGFQVEDTVAMALTFESGALGTFILSDVASSNRSWEMTSGENPAYPWSTDANCYHFAGTMGSLDFPTMRVRTYLGSDGPSWWNSFVDSQLESERADPLERQLDHFVDVIHAKTPPVVSAELGLANMRVLEAIRQSVSTRSSVDVNSISVARLQA